MKFNIISLLISLIIAVSIYNKMSATGREYNPFNLTPILITLPFFVFYLFPEVKKNDKRFIKYYNWLSIILSVSAFVFCNFLMFLSKIR
jgi:TRAP-type uncharacterized transport system fused permease subunit